MKYKKNQIIITHRTPFESTKAPLPFIARNELKVEVDKSVAVIFDIISSLTTSETNKPQNKNEFSTKKLVLLVEFECCDS